MSTTSQQVAGFNKTKETFKEQLQLATQSIESALSELDELEIDDSDFDSECDVLIESIIGNDMFELLLEKLSNYSALEYNSNPALREQATHFHLKMAYAAIKQTN